MIKAWASLEKGKPVEKFEYEPNPLGSQDVEVEIEVCGICHSDLHLIDDDWGMSSYPLVPGHEVVGKVRTKGDDVSHLEIGDRVGIGWQARSCLTCEYCVRGDDHLCQKQEATCLGNYGGFAEAIRVQSHFAFKIPESLTSENAAPLLCGGATVYSPFINYQVSHLDRVGVIGIGGLGHLALQFARALGCEVTAFSSSKDKESEAKKFGAHRFIASRDPSEIKKAAGTLDFIVNTAFADLDWNAYLETLRPNGKLCFVGVPQKPIEVPVFSLLIGQRSICGSVIGGRKAIPEMLTFAARHGVEAQTERAPMVEANAALDRLRAGQARYRMVLAN